MKNKRVNIKWPGGGKTGEHEVTNIAEWDYKVWVNGRACVIPEEWCEPAGPEIEEGQLVYVYDVFGKCLGARFYDGDPNNWFHVEPAHRRWEELTGPEQDEFVGRIKNACFDNFKSVGVSAPYIWAYKLITGKNHP